MGTTGARRRVLHLIESGGIYGAERVILNLSREMLVKGDFEPVIGCIVQRDDERVDLVEVARDYGIEAHRIRIANARVLFELPRAARELQRLQIDLIHVHGYKPAVYAYFLRRLSGIEIFATCHLWFVDANAPWKMRIMMRIEKRLYRHYPAIAAVSEDIQRILLDHEVAQDRISLIRNGIALSDYSMCTRVRRPGEPIRVLNVARLSEQKAQCDLVAAASLMDPSIGCVQVDIVGDGELRAVLERQIERAGVTDRVRLLGFRQDVRSVLAEADIFVLPSLDEGMPMSLLEAVASKVPAIVTAVGDVPKLIVDGETGIVVPKSNPQVLAQAIERLVRQPDLGRRLADNAWERLRREYSSEQMLEAYSRLYERLVPQ